VNGGPKSDNRMIIKFYKSSTSAAVPGETDTAGIRHNRYIIFWNWDSHSLMCCGRTRARPMHSETWWWNDEVAELVKEKRRLFKMFDKSKRGIGSLDIEENKIKYEVAKRAAKRGIVKAQRAEQEKFCEKLDEEDRKEQCSE